VLCFAGIRFYQDYSRVRWVKEHAIPEITRLVDSGESKAAFRMLRRAEAILPGDANLTRIRHDNAFDTPITTNPQGAEVSATGYDPNDDDWLRLGTTPLVTRELPWGFYRLRIEKPGCRTVLGTGEVRGGTSLHFELDRTGSIPDEMVRVPGGSVSTPGFPDAKLGSFLIDRFETTNRQFQEFINQGGYQKREYWKVDFIRDGNRMSWDEATRVFVDSTGRPGPSTWQSGTFPPGREHFPVSGVSWYEAAAYAEFARKQLPTAYHWQQAAAPGFYADITDVSNFGGAGPARVGSYSGLGAFGTLDMAGNVREWCWNDSAGRRLVRGGAWSDLAYMFSDVDAVEPWDRSAQNGIRCVRYDAAAETGIQAPVTRFSRDYRHAKPVPNSVFRHFQSLYAYDSHDLNALSEGTDQDTPAWRREKVTFAAAYENERITGYLYIPKRAVPPYQAVIYGNPGMAFRLASPQPAEERFFEFLVKSGRAFLLPVLKGQYQRRYTAPARGPHAIRDRLILESKDFRRTIDYLTSRPDIDRERLGVYGLSRAAVLLPVLAVGEQRLKAAVLVSVGLPPYSQQLPESDVFHFVTRFRVPTLMINGRSDFVFPLEASQMPMFRLLGPPAEDKRLSLTDGGHAWTNFQPAMKEALEWFDRYLGPVK
jgi:formylglycine-generating enzyme required for sulfatase activity/predicted esterase